MERHDNASGRLIGTLIFVSILTVLVLSVLTVLTGDIVTALQSSCY